MFDICPLKSEYDLFVGFKRFTKLGLLVISRGLMLWLFVGPTGFTCWISFAPVFSFTYC